MDKNAFIDYDRAGGETHCGLCGGEFGDEPLMIYKMNGKVICHSCMGWSYAIWCETGLKAEKRERERILRLVDELKNPYPKNMFIEPTKKQWELFHKVLKLGGLTLDKFSGIIGRRLFDSIKDELKQKIEE